MTAMIKNSEHVRSSHALTSITSESNCSRADGMPFVTWSSPAVPLNLGSDCTFVMHSKVRSCFEGGGAVEQVVGGNTGYRICGCSAGPC